MNELGVERGMTRRRGGTGLQMAAEIWSRRKWLAILAFAVSLVALASGVKALPARWRATATVLVDREQVPEALVKPSMTGEAEVRLQTLSQKILSRARLGDLIDRFSLYPGLRARIPREALAEKMRRDIELEMRGVQPGAWRSTMVAFALSYSGGAPETVAEVTNALASFFIEENNRIGQRQASATSDLLKARLGEVKGQLEEQEQRLGEFRARHSGELPEQVGANLAVLDRLNSDLQRNRERQLHILYRRESAVERGEGGDGPEALAGRLAAKKRELSELRARYSEKYPDVIRLQAEIRALESRLEESAPASQEGEGGGASEARAEPSEEMRSLKAEEAKLRNQIAAYQGRIETAPRTEQEIQQLTRDYQTTKELYESLLKKDEEARLQGRMEQQQMGEQFRILDPAVPPRVPVGPPRSRLYLLALAVSLAFAAGVVAVAEQADTSFHSVDDLREFSRVPVLASIPQIVTRADRRRRLLRFALGAAAALLMLVMIGGGSWYFAHDNEGLASLLSRGGS